MSPTFPLCSTPPGSGPTPGLHCAIVCVLGVGGIVVSTAAFQVDSSVLDSTERKSVKLLGCKCTKKQAKTTSPYSGPDPC